MRRANISHAAPIVSSSGLQNINTAWRALSMIFIAVWRLCGQPAGNPSGDASQSRARSCAPETPPPPGSSVCLHGRRQPLTLSAATRPATGVQRARLAIRRRPNSPSAPDRHIWASSTSSIRRLATSRASSAVVPEAGCAMLGRSPVAEMILTQTARSFEVRGLIW